MAHPKHQAVRRHYDYRCGYCGVSETDTGGELTVDHFRPVAAGGGDDEENLVYACHRCNGYKRDVFLNAADLAQGRRLLHPLRDDMNTHIVENAAHGALKARTETGRFHITILQLNRPGLLAHRLDKRFIALMREELQLNRIESVQQRAVIAKQEELIGRLQKNPTPDGDGDTGGS